MKKRKIYYKPKDVIYGLLVVDIGIIDVYICSKEFFEKNNDIDSELGKYEFISKLLRNNDFYQEPKELIYTAYTNNIDFNSVEEILDKLKSLGFTMRDEIFENWIVDNLLE